MTRFLLVRLGALGDVVHAIPVAAALRRTFPDARIDWLVSPKYREFLELVRAVDHPVALEGSLLASIGALRRTKYDVAIDLQGLMKSAALARGSGAGRVIGFSPRFLREPLARLFYTERHEPAGAGMLEAGEAIHVVRANLSLLEPLGVPTAEPEFPIARPESAVARALAERAGGRYVVLNPGAGWPNKRWPAPRFGDLARAVHARYGLRSVVVWGPGEEDLAHEVVAAAGDAVELAPPTTIADLVAILGGAVLMVAGDTGPFHLAAALGTPVIGIYGPTRPDRNGPFSAADLTVSRHATCQCLYRRACRLETMCLAEIGVHEVLGAIERRFSLERAHA